MKSNNWKYLYRIRKLEIKSWMKYLMLQGKEVIDYVLGELMTGTDITINNTVEKTFYKFDIKGNSTTGKNFLPVTNQDFTINGVRFKAEDGKILISGTATANVTGFIMKDVSYFPVTLQAGTYYLTRNLTNVSVGLIQKTSDTVVATLSSTSTAKSISFTLSSATDLYLFFYVASGTTISNYSGEIMVSTSGGDWEKYTNGASPNPSYPQEIYSAGDDIQLFDKTTITPNTRLSADGYPFSDNNYFLTDYIPVKGNTTYKANSEFFNLYNRIAYYDENKSIISLNNGNDVDYFVTPANTKFVRFAKANNKLDTFKLVEGTNVGAYSSYGMGSISEKIVNKNLCKITSVTPYYYASGLPSTQSTSLIIDSFDINNITFHTTASAYNIALTNIIQLQPNTEYTMSFNRTDSETVTNKQWFIYNYDGTNYTINYRDNNVGLTSKTFTTNSQGKIALAFGHGSVTGNTTISNIQIELGSTATNFVAHQEQTYTIPVQQPMRSIGTVRDEFVKVNGEWKERHNLGRVVLNGSENWIYSSYTNETIYSVFVPLTNQKNNSLFISNKFSYLSSISGSTVVEYIGANGTSVRLGVFKTRLSESSITGLKTWLNSNNVEVIYELATPVDLPCTEEQISILENLPKSYNEQTNIYSLDVTPAYLEVQAYVKKEEVIEND